MLLVSVLCSYSLSLNFLSVEPVYVFTSPSLVVMVALYTTAMVRHSPPTGQFAMPAWKLQFFCGFDYFSFLSQKFGVVALDNSLHVLGAAVAEFDGVPIDYFL